MTDPTSNRGDGLVGKALASQDPEREARQLQARRAAQRAAWQAATFEPVPSWLRGSVPEPKVKPRRRKPAAWAGENRRETNRRGADRRVIKLDTTMDRPNADKLVARHGLTGRLDSKLPRSERMRVYEARYVAAGGPKGEKWARRAEGAQRVRNASLGIATGTAGAMVLRGTGAARAVGRLKPVRRVRPQHLERTAWGSAAAGGSAELYGNRAERRRGAYRSAPAGVAASALTRMRQYDEGA